MLEEDIARKQEEIERATLALENLKVAAEEAAPVCSKLSELGVEHELLGLTYFWPGVAWGEVKIQVALQNQESWAVAIPLFEAVEAFGFSLDSWTSVDDAKNFARTYTAAKAKEGQHIKDIDSKQEVSIRITVALKEGNSGGCHRVFVGTHRKTTVQEKEEYHLICDEASTEAA